jgi:hypothetical protein
VRPRQLCVSPASRTPARGAGALPRAHPRDLPCSWDSSWLSRFSSGVWVLSLSLCLFQAKQMTCSNHRAGRLVICICPCTCDRLPAHNMPSADTGSEEGWGCSTPATNGSGKEGAAIQQHHIYGSRHGTYGVCFRCCLHVLDHCGFVRRQLLLPAALCHRMWVTHRRP